jgi:Cu/Ag efflux pump CusA
LKNQDVKIVPYLDRSDLVSATVDKVSHTILEGIGLVFVVLILFLGSPRSALIVAITIPMSMLIAFILMKMTNIPANLLSLGAIDFGIIVNAPIIVIEAVLRQREARPNETLTEDDALQPYFTLQGRYFLRRSSSLPPISPCSHYSASRRSYSFPWPTQLLIRCSALCCFL